MILPELYVLAELCKLPIVSNRGIPYTQLYDWLRKRQKLVVKVEVEGLPSDDSSSSGSHP